MLYKDDPDQMYFAVKHMKLHEHYNSNTVENDICMLKLDGEATFGPNIAWIGFPASMEEYEAGTDCIVTGWGTTTEGGSLGTTLQKVTDNSFSYLFSFSVSYFSFSLSLIQGDRPCGLGHCLQGRLRTE